jgi:undecaprenyl-phosphate 4-deoxy-4-formamido-L-arabinose transferase
VGVVILGVAKPNEDSTSAEKSRPALSLVIPVYNGGATIRWLVDQIHEVFRDIEIEVVLVNDGSTDYSEGACALLVEKYPGTVCYTHLARNFGEHNAVLAGLRQATGRYVAVLDDDGQNPPHEVLRMLDHAQQHDLDVVYGRYQQRKHSWPRRLGSWFNDRVANFVLDKPRGIYLSSFKVMSRLVVDEVVKYGGPFPYIDGLLLRSTRNVDEIAVVHCPRRAGRSGYTLSKLLGLWLNMFLGFSVAPLRLALAVGATASALSLLMLVAIVVDKICINPEVTVGIPSVLTCIALFAGVQLMMLGMLGEYVGRVFLQQNGVPQYVVRYVQRGAAVAPALHDTRLSDEQTLSITVP